MKEEKRKLLLLDELEEKLNNDLEQYKETVTNLPSSEVYAKSNEIETRKQLVGVLMAAILIFRDLPDNIDELWIKELLSTSDTVDAITSVNREPRRIYTAYDGYLLMRNIEGGYRKEDKLDVETKP